MAAQDKARRRRLGARLVVARVAEQLEHSGRMLLHAAWIVLLAGATARAEPTSPTADGGQDSSSPHEQAPDDRDRARQLYGDATRAYEAGSYQEALALLRAAYAAFPTNRFLFNIAQTQRQLGACSEARETYLRFLEDETDPELRARALVGLSRLSECETPAPVSDSLAPDEAQQQSRADPPSSDAEARSDAARRARRMRGGWIASGVLAGSTAIVGGFMISALRTLGDLEDTKPVVPRTVADAERRSRSLAIATDTLAAATLLASGLSLFWTLTMPRSEPRAEPTAERRRRPLQLAASPLRVSLRLEF